LFGKKANDEQQPNTHAHRHMLAYAHACTHTYADTRSRTNRKKIQGGGAAKQVAADVLPQDQVQEIRADILATTRGRPALV
jgi:hypothetical protein